MTNSAPRLLIIDDRPDPIALLLSFLDERELDILVALDGEDGLIKAVEGRPDLILLDVVMPGLDGFTVCERLKADPRVAAVPVVFLTASAELSDKLRGFAVGGVDYITKPFSEQEVLARISVQLDTRRQVRWLEAQAADRFMNHLNPPPDPEQRIFAAAVAQLEQQLQQPLGLVELAHRVGTNERRLTELFRRQVGMTVFDYLAELRLESARRLLEGSTTQVQLIADRVGYRNAGDLSRAFRRRYGVSPREYRRALGTEEGPV